VEAVDVQGAMLVSEFEVIILLTPVSAIVDV
jgi:hypothetical protein